MVLQVGQAGLLPTTTMPTPSTVDFTEGPAVLSDWLNVRSFSQSFITRELVQSIVVSEVTKRAKADALKPPEV